MCLQQLTMCISKCATKTHDELERPLNLDNIDENLWNDECDYIDLESCTNLNPNDNNLIVLQLNIRSILSNQTETAAPNFRKQKLKSRYCSAV